MEDGIVDIWPNFFEGEGASVNDDVRNPSLVGLCKRALLARIVEICYAGGRSCTQDLAYVKGFVARIRTSDDNPGKRVPQPFDKRSFAQGVVPIVLAENR